ncbi:MAG TPA: hypothetical protein VFV34_00120 [Blastocatellia bacterium]|nr:hypothetical protein [Blastocatellia bacterium]
MTRKLLRSYAVFQNLGGTRDIVFYYEAGGADSVTGVGATEADYIADLLRNEKPMSYDHSLRRLSTWTPEPVGEGEHGPDLDAWLNVHPSIANSIVWEDSGGSHAWSSWSADRRAQLRAAFDLARMRSSVPVPDVPANQATMADNDPVTTILSAADAWAYFKSSVAQALAEEIGQQLLWSIQGYSADALAQLFDSRQMFRWNNSPAGYRINSEHGHIVPAPPLGSYSFLGTGNLIGNTRLDTISRVIGWCRDNLVHFTGGTNAANMEDQWQYTGFPPMTRVLDGTLQTSHPQFGVMHRTAGCWGTVGFLRALLRAVNIPVKLVTNAGHAQPWFVADSRYMSHGDDPYNALTKATPPFPPSEILIDQAKFDSWFGGGVSAADKLKNVGRRTRELAITYLPNYLLHKYCSDIANSKTHSNGEVFDIFKANYTVAQLEAQTLWSRMDAKIAGFGGCSHVP